MTLSDWRACFDLGNQCYARGDYPQALDHYLQALNLNQGSWEVRNNLAVLLKLLGERAVAETCLREALALNPDYLDAWINLGNLYRGLQRYDEAHQCFDAALTLAPRHAELLSNLGLLFKEQGRLAEAIDSYRRATALADAPAEAFFNGAIALIQSGDYREGFRWYEQRWRMPRMQALRQPLDQAMPEWRGEPLAGKTLLVWHEQGLGDMIQMARYLPLWKAAHPGCRLALRVDAPLVPLLTCLAGVDLLVSSQAALPPADYHLSAMSFPFVWGTMPESIPSRAPYLTADAALTQRWAARLGPKGQRPRLGVVWQSGDFGVGLGEIDRQSRSLPPEALAALLDRLDADWLSLQVGGDALPPALAARLIAPGAIGDFADTAAILTQLDALITVDTAAAHLGGALGVPTVVLMRALGGNLFPADGERMPWYASMRLARQTRLFDWQPVIADLPRLLSQVCPLPGIG
ncbi:MAG: tetratricopeptide repeat protein [Paludibacterium sp.]|uniref:tetratricopeptide repeat-containing glycosyltransferase family protein n=1 Tax=Paludibacterium sp. TaxID=1917523 RepID=UPI0025D84AB3|nr:tetratricopeptide repeat protein [Paludibacterium sp.]MBV8048680.1 tetratricopeptide repeat protein [Paludibacterium sp.]